MRTMLFCSFVVAALVVPGLANAQNVHVEVTNPIQLARPSAVVSVPWTDLLRVAPGMKAAGISVRPVQSSLELPTQVVDRDQDGVPEELLFQTDIPAGGKRIFEVRTGIAVPSTPALTDARYVEPREDVAWENDRIAFRMYGPALAKEVNNGLDVWTKRVRYPIVAKWYAAAARLAAEHPGAKDPYHVDTGEGADFFDVGRSLGCGSCALLMGDSLYQPGVFSSYRIISAGPIRAEFELTYAPVTCEGMTLVQKMDIALDAGRNFNRITVTFSTPSPKAPVTIAAGLVQRSHIIEATDAVNHWAALWGPTNGDSTNGSLGTGLVVPSNAFTGFKALNHQTLLLTTTMPGLALTYYAGAGWTRSGDVLSAAEWARALNTCASEARSPLVVKVDAAAEQHPLQERVK